MLKGLLKYVLALVAVLLALWFAITQPVLVRAGSSQNLPPVDPAVLQQHVATLSEKLPGRLGLPSELEPTLLWLEQTLKPYAKPERQTYPSVGQIFHNLVIRFGPVTGPVLVIGAHYDTAHGMPGADDNASGVAGLLELVRLLALAEKSGTLQRRVELVFYTLEESRFHTQKEMGSYVHADSLAKANTEVELMVSLEMIGYFADAKGSQYFPLSGMEYLYTDRGNFIGVISNLSNMAAVRTVKKSFKRSIGAELPVYSLNGPEDIVPGIGASDHRSYWALDYPAVMVTDTAYMRNPNYHTPRDTAEKLDYARMALVVQATYQLVMDLNAP